MINTSNMLNVSFDLLKLNRLLPCPLNQSWISQAFFFVNYNLAPCWLIVFSWKGTRRVFIFPVDSLISISIQRKFWKLNYGLFFYFTCMTLFYQCSFKHCSHSYSIHCNYGGLWMLAARNGTVLRNTTLVYMMWYTIRHIGRVLNCFPGVLCVFPGLWASLWLCWWGLLWRTPASVPALKLGRWWVHLLQFLRHSCNCKIYEGLLKSPGYCKLQYQFRFSYSYKITRCLSLKQY